MKKSSPKSRPRSRRPAARSKRGGVSADLRLLKIDDALDRMSLGLYPLCTRCGQRIEAERLRADPAESLCAGCAARPSGKHPRG